MKDAKAVSTLGAGEPVAAEEVSVPSLNVADAIATDLHTESRIGSGQESANTRKSSKIRSAQVEQHSSCSTGKIRSVSPALLQARSAKRECSAPVGKRMQSLYPTERPKQKFLRVHPSREYRQMGVLTYSDPDTNELYYVAPELEVPESYGMPIKVTDMYAAQAHDGTFFIWCVNRSESTWYRSALKAIEMCTHKWFKVVSRRGPNIYDLYPSEKEIPEPDWSNLPAFGDMLESAFDGKRIESLEHPVVRKARGYPDEE